LPVSRSRTYAPPSFSERTREALDELLEFRHSFRHADALDLRADKLARVLDRFITGHAMIDGELRAVATFIERTVDRLEARQ
jgi:hypothetical protein